jgi:DNA polymerase phi
MNIDEDGYSENDRDDDKSSTSVEDSESVAANNGEMNNMSETLQTIYIDATAESAEEESENDLNDDQMMMMDDQLALMFQDRAGERRSKGTPSRLARVAHV